MPESAVDEHDGLQDVEDDQLAVPPAHIEV
jgi:hypothetical protein